MPTIKLEIEISAARKRVFELARCIDLHESSMSKYDEKAADGISKGLICLGEVVTREATHFGFRLRLTSKITKYDTPNSFQDTMIKGAFKSFIHDHIFEENESITKVRDVFDYTSPFGLIGKIADSLFLESYMKRMLRERSELIKKVAESEEWEHYLS